MFPWVVLMLESYHLKVYTPCLIVLSFCVVLVRDEEDLCTVYKCVALEIILGHPVRVRSGQVVAWREIVLYKTVEA